MLIISRIPNIYGEKTCIVTSYPQQVAEKKNTSIVVVIVPG